MKKIRYKRRRKCYTNSKRFENNSSSDEINNIANTIENQNSSYTSLSIKILMAV